MSFIRKKFQDDPIATVFQLLSIVAMLSAGVVWAWATKDTLLAVTVRVGFVSVIAAVGLYSLLKVAKNAHSLSDVSMLVVMSVGLLFWSPDSFALQTVRAQRGLADIVIASQLILVDSIEKLDDENEVNRAAAKASLNDLRETFSKLKAERKEAKEITPEQFVENIFVLLSRPLAIAFLGFAPMGLVTFLIRTYFVKHNTAEPK